MEGSELWRELGQQLRVDSVRAAAVPKSGHPTSSMSAADLMAVLLAKYLRYDFDKPDDPRNDHLVFSKGHASPLLYSMYKAAGAITDEELLTFRKFGSRLEGHPVPVLLPWVDVATGSLGQGLPYGVGIALAGKRLDRLPYRIWVLCGDSEMAEGSMWEAFEHAWHEQLDNLIAIIDVNRLGQRGETMHGWDLDSYAKRAEAFGWHAIEIDGHDVEAIDAAYAEALETYGHADRDRGQDDQGQGREGGREQGRLPRQGARRSGSRDRGARRDPQHHDRRREAGVRRRAASLRARDARASVVRGRRRRRDPQGVRRHAQGPRRRAWGRRRARRRGLELDVRRDLPRRAPGPVLRDVHRRAADGRGRGRDPGARVEAVRVDVRGVSDAGRTTSSAWRRSAARI